VVNLPESSWGAGGDHSVWLNNETASMWPLIHRAERTIEDLAAAFPNASGDRLRALNQAARELLLLESSDWPFLVTTGQAKEYASDRFTEHLGRFDTAVELARLDELTDEQQTVLSALEERDNPFSDIDYRNFSARQGSSERRAT
jgi:1,4-alpha-glucan branching enzyme